MQHVVSLFWNFDLISIIAGSSPVSCSKLFWNNPPRFTSWAMVGCHSAWCRIVAQHAATSD